MTKTFETDTSPLPISDTFEIQCAIPNITIAYNDTIVDNKNYKVDTIKSFDDKGRLIKLFIYNPYEGNSENFHSSTSIYDAAGHLIYEDKIDNLVLWHCYKYKYDIRGNLILKTGFILYIIRRKKIPLTVLILKKNKYYGLYSYPKHEN